MSELDDLYAAVLAEPDSDAPRLVYADALQAAGDPRGELIAIQCELARLGCDRTRVALSGGLAAGEHARRDWIGDGFVTADPLRIAALRERERALLAAHAVEWVGEDFECRFRRGFIDHAHVSDLVAREDVWAAAPLLRSMELTQLGPEPFGDGRLAQLEQLRFSCVDGVDRDAFLECAPRLTLLRELAIHDPYREPALPLLELPFLPQLEAIDLYGYRFPHAGVLEELLNIAQLRELHLGDLSPPVDVLYALTHHPRAQQLEVLDLYLADIQPDFASWVAAGYLTGLQAVRILDHSTTWLGGGLGALAALPRLRILDLGGSTRLVPHLPELAAGSFPALAQLGIAGCRLGDAGLELLAGSSLLRRLRVLDLAHNQLTHRGALSLMNTRLDNLRVLDLRANHLDPTTVTALRMRFPRAHIMTGER